MANEHQTWVRRLAMVAVLSLATLLVYSALGKSPTDRLHNLANAKVDAADFATDWDHVCVAGPYCGGFSPSEKAICDRFLDKAWGLVFLKRGKLIAVERFTLKVEYVGPVGQASCQGVDALPAFFAVGPNKLTFRSAKK